MIPSVRIAAVQCVSTADVAANQQVLARLTQAAAEAGADVVIWPENALYFGDDPYGAAADAPSWLAWACALARQHGIYVITGTWPERTRPNGNPVPAGRVRAAAYGIDAQGVCCGRSDKWHLFDAQVADGQGRYAESDRFEPGDTLTLLPSPWGPLGVLVCYDLRFPELARALVARGAVALCVPAAFTAVTGEAHWQTLLRARAIENQCAVVGSGQGGWHTPQRETWGHSQIIDAWGVILAERHESGAGLVWADWNLQAQQDLRARMPCLAHQRLAVSESAANDCK